MSAENSDAATLDIEGAVATIVLNRPSRLNAMNGAMIAALESHIESVEQDDRVRAVVLRGAGKGFSAGADLMSGEVQGPEGVGAYLNRIGGLIEGILHSRVPWVAALHGPVTGVSTGLALACDMIVMAEDAYWYWAFSRLGIGVDGGGSWFLPKLMGVHRAKEMLMFHEKVSAAEAAELGLANRIVAIDVFDEAVDTVATKLAQGPTLALGAIKSAVNRNLNKEFSEAFAIESEHQQALLVTQDAMAGMMAFAQKQDPEFQGS